MKKLKSWFLSFFQKKKAPAKAPCVLEHPRAALERCHLRQINKILEERSAFWGVFHRQPFYKIKWKPISGKNTSSEGK